MPRTVPEPSTSWWRVGSATIANNSAAGACTSTDRLIWCGPAIDDRHTHIAKIPNLTTRIDAKFPGETPGASGKAACEVLLYESLCQRVVPKRGIE